jgi:hypothetical protein
MNILICNCVDLNIKNQHGLYKDEQTEFMRHARLLLAPAYPNMENTDELPNATEKLQDEPGPEDRTRAELFDDDLSVADEGSDADSRVLGVCRISA